LAVFELGNTWGEAKKALLWDGAHGWRTVQSFLSSKGVSLSRGWKLTACRGVAINNGFIMLCGSGTHNNKPEAWVAGAVAVTSQSLAVQSRGA
jgi:hypothetical protein